MATDGVQVYEGDGVEHDVPASWTGLFNYTFRMHTRRLWRRTGAKRVVIGNWHWAVGSSATRQAIVNEGYDQAVVIRSMEEAQRVCKAADCSNEPAVQATVIRHPQFPDTYVEILAVPVVLP